MESLYISSTQCLLYLWMYSNLYFFRYVNGAPQFSDATRVISFRVNDGIINSTPAFTYICELVGNEWCCGWMGVCQTLTSYILKVNLNHCCWLLMLQSQVCAHIAVCTKIKITQSFLHGNLLSVFVEYDSFVSVLVYATWLLCVHKQQCPVGYKLFI